MKYWLTCYVSLTVQRKSGDLSMASQTLQGFSAQLTLEMMNCW